MLLFILLKGILLGLAIAAPVGPIALLCVRRTLTQGWQVGLVFGLGAATADGLYGVVLTNPATILSFIAIFADLGITQTSYLSSVTLVFGVFTGSALWWLMLVSGVTYLRRQLTPQQLSRFNQSANRVFGALIFGFGMATLLAEPLPARQL